MSQLRQIICRARRKVCHWRGDLRGVARWSNRLATVRVLPKWQKTFNEVRLPDIGVEVATDCNYACSFCPQSHMRRPAQYMTEAGFGILIDRLKEVRFSSGLTLAVNNEPFMHPLLMRFCRKISDDLPGVGSAIITNGSLVTAEHLNYLAGLSHPPSVRISDYTSDHRVAGRIRDILDQMLNRSRLRIIIDERNSEERLSGRAGNCALPVWPVEDYRDVFCTWPFTGMIVAPDLSTHLCCSDYRYETRTGDLKCESLRQIWQGPICRETRRRMLKTQRNDLPLCSRCDTEWFG